MDDVHGMPTAWHRRLALPSHLVLAFLYMVAPSWHRAIMSILTYRGWSCHQKRGLSDQTFLHSRIPVLRASGLSTTR